MSASTHLSSARSSCEEQNMINVCLCIIHLYYCAAWKKKKKEKRNTFLIEGASQTTQAERSGGVICIARKSTFEHFPGLLLNSYFGRVLVPRGLVVCSRFHISSCFPARTPPLCSVFALLFLHHCGRPLVAVAPRSLLPRLACLLLVFGLLGSASQLCTVGSWIQYRQRRGIAEDRLDDEWFRC